MNRSLTLWFFLFVGVSVAHLVEDTGESGYVGDIDKGRGGCAASTCCLTCGGRTSSSRWQTEETTFYVRRTPTEPLTRAAAAVVATLYFPFFALIFIGIYAFLQPAKTTLMMVQVAVKTNSSEIQHDLSLFLRIANEWMSANAGLRFLLSETISRILLHPECCYSGTSFVESIVQQKGNDWVHRFEEICLEQRNKSNGRIVEQSIRKQDDEYVVVTVIVAAHEDHQLPAINCPLDLEKAICRLKSVAVVRDVKVFWTVPVGSEELAQQFPQLKRL